MYYGLVVSGIDVHTVSFHGDAAFYPAHAPMKDRHQPGLRFELAPGGPWRWTGPAGPPDVTLADILAAVNYARIAKLPGYEAIDLASIHAAHDRAMQAALAGGGTELAGRLMHEQSEVAAAALISEEAAARQLGIKGRSLNIIRLQYRSICPPVLIAGERRTKWFWAPGQFSAWRTRRPGKGWKGRRPADPDGAGLAGTGRAHQDALPQPAGPACAGRSLTAAGRTRTGLLLAGCFTGVRL